MSSTNKTTYYELSQYVGSDKPTYLGDYNSDMLKIDTAIHTASDNADTALTTANAANSAATSASTTASTALSTAQTASTTASQAQTTAETALTNSGAAQTAAEEAETAARANTITNLAPAYDATLTYDVGDLVTYIDGQGSGKMYKCIVAITTPEAFNINKWDDVTATEAFTHKPKIYTRVFTASETFADLLNWMRSVVLETPIAEQIMLEMHSSSATWDEKFTIGDVSTDWVKFNRYTVRSKFEAHTMGLYKPDASRNFFAEWYSGDATVSYVPLTNNVPAGTYTIYNTAHIYE